MLAARFAVTLLAGMLSSLAFNASAQSYPSKPIRMIIGFTPGGGIDTTARIIGKFISDKSGQPVVVENKPGAGSSIASEFVVKAPPDGYTLLALTTASTVLPALRELTYDTERDLAPVAQLASGAAVLLVNSARPIRSVKELVALARSNPGQMKYATTGIGSSTHLMALQFTGLANLDMVSVPYKGSPEANAGVLSGDVDMVFANLTESLPHIKSGKVRALGVITPQRTPYLPDVPTLNEAGVTGYEYSIFYGLAAPAATPRNIIGQLNGWVREAQKTPEVIAYYRNQGIDPTPISPDQFGALIHRYIEINKKLAKMAGAIPQ